MRPASSARTYASPRTTSAITIVRLPWAPWLTPPTVDKQEYVSDLLRMGVKFLLFGYHMDCIRALEEHIARQNVGFVHILGETPGHERALNVRRFQEDPNIR